MIKKKNNIAFVAGKTGGHILPCLTIAQQYKEQNPSINMIFFSTNAPLDRSLLSKQSVITDHIMLPLGRFSKKLLLRHVCVMWQLMHSFAISLYNLHKHKVEKVVSSGGLITVPVALAATILRIPIELYELNAVPGKAIKAIAPLAQKIYICFANAKRYFTKYPCIYAPYPIRFAATDKQMSKEEACNKIGLDPHKKTLFIMGGSQGSLQLSNAIKKYMEISDNISNIQIIHQTGARDQTDWRTFYADKNIPALIFDYREDVAPCYIAADLIISRAGAGMLFEILFFEKPSIIIPLEASTTSHQRDNAYAMQCEYPTLFTVIQQDELTNQNNPLHRYLDNFVQSNIVVCAQKNPAQSEV